MASSPGRNRSHHQCGNWLVPVNIKGAQVPILSMIGVLHFLTIAFVTSVDLLPLSFYAFLMSFYGYLEYRIDRRKLHITDSIELQLTKPNNIEPNLVYRS